MLLEVFAILASVVSSTAVPKGFSLIGKGTILSTGKPLFKTPIVVTDFTWGSNNNFTFTQDLNAVASIESLLPVVEDGSALALNFAMRQGLAKTGLLTEEMRFPEVYMGDLEILNNNGITEIVAGCFWSASAPQITYPNQPTGTATVPGGWGTVTNTPAAKA